MLGKMMAVREILLEERLALSWDESEVLVNLIFPRSFIPEPNPFISPALEPDVLPYYEDRLSEFCLFSLGSQEALGETAHHFNCTEAGIRKVLKRG